MKKEDYIKWSQKDPTIDEASYLWFDIDPHTLEGLTPEIALKISIIKERLEKEAGLSKKIWHKDSGNFIDINSLLNTQGGKSIIDIESLKEYAVSIGQRPKFLFPATQQIQPVNPSGVVSNEDFIKELRIFYENNYEIKIQTPKKKAVTYTCESIGFRDSETIEWKTLCSILQEEGIYNIGVAHENLNGTKVRIKSYDTKRKLLNNINKKLLTFFSNEYGLQFPDDYKLYELCPEHQSGTYRFKFQVDKTILQTKDVCKKKDKALLRIKELYKGNASQDKINDAVLKAKELGISNDELEDIIKNPIQSVYEKEVNRFAFQRKEE